MQNKLIIEANELSLVTTPGMQAQAAPLTIGDSMLGMIERLAANPDVDIIKMQALLDMRNQELTRVNNEHQFELARVAKQEFNVDYVAMGGELPLVAKGKLNTHTKSKYAVLEDINQAIKPTLSKYGFSITCNILEQTDKSVTVEVTLIHKGGHDKSVKLTFPIDNKGSGGTVNKTDIQGIASTITYAKRIGICALVNISTGDDVDGNGNNDVLATDIQRTAIMGLYNKLTEAQQDNFNERTGGVLEIRKADVDKTIALLNKSISEKK